MDKIKSFFVGILLAALCFSFSFAEGKYAPQDQAPLAITREISIIKIKKDGSSSEEDEIHFKVQNDQGRMEAAVQKLAYVRHDEKIRILWAKTVNKYREFDVPRGQILDQSKDSAKMGITDLREKVIPFSNLEIGSEIQYRFIREKPKPTIKGIYSNVFYYGLDFPEMNGDVQIISETPIYSFIRDPNKYLETKESRDGDKYVLEIANKKMIYHMPDHELLSVIDPNTVPTVFVGINKNWSEVVSAISASYEKILSQNLPQLYKDIQKKAEAAPTDLDKINIVTSEIEQQMTYSGEWKTSQDYMIPKDLSKIAKLKTGDCKDFATATTAILRKMGMNASVALVQRTNMAAPMTLMMRPNGNEKIIPTLAIWNHAIVKVISKDNKIIWVDPTNLVSHAGYVKPDILHSPALALDSTSNAIETVNPLLEDSQITAKTTIQPREDGSARMTSTVGMSGVVSVELQELSWLKGADPAKKAIAAIVGLQDKPPYGFTIEGFAEKNRVMQKMNMQVNGTTESPVKEKKDEKEKNNPIKLFIDVPLPPQLALFELPLEDRSSHIAVGTELAGDSETEIIGYEPKDIYSVECLLISPWVDLERYAKRTKDGFIVVNHFRQKQTILFKDQMKSTNMVMFQSAEGRCLEAQRIEVVKISTDPKNPRAPLETLPNLEEALDLSQGRGSQNMMKARRMLLTLLEKDPKNPQIHDALGRIFVILGYMSNDDYAEEYVDASSAEADLAMAADPNSASAHIAKARVFNLRKKLDEAKIELSAAYKIDPKNPSFYSLAGAISQKEKKYDLAERYYLARIPLVKPEYRAGIYNTLGCMKNDQKAYDQSIAYFKKGLELDPKDGWLWGDAMNTYMAMEKWDDAIEYGKKSLEISEYGVFRNGLSNVYTKKGLSLMKNENMTHAQELETEKMFQAALKLKSDKIQALKGLGELYLKMGLKTKDRIVLTQSKEYLERVLAKYPRDNNVIHNLMLALEGLGMKQEYRMPANSAGN